MESLPLSSPMVKNRVPTRFVFAPFSWTPKNYLNKFDGHWSFPSTPIPNFSVPLLGFWFVSSPHLFLHKMMINNIHLGVFHAAKDQAAFGGMKRLLQLVFTCGDVVVSLNRILIYTAHRFQWWWEGTARARVSNFPS